MHRKHLTWEIDAYLNNTLSVERRQTVEAHLKSCPSCARRLAETQSLAHEIQQTMKSVLGNPTPPPTLRHQVRRKLQLEAPTRPNRPSRQWLPLGRLVNALATLSIILGLVAGILAIIQTQNATNLSPTQVTAERPAETSHTALPPSTTPSPTGTPLPVVVSTIEDQTPLPTVTSLLSAGPTPERLNTPTPEAHLLPTKVLPTKTVSKPMIVPTISPTRLSSSPTSPTGLIAFSFFNPAPQRQIYEIHLINANGTEHRLFPLDGVSEPALRWTGQDHQLAYRAWSEPTAPRSLLSGSLDGRQINQVGGFWEDAQPDWSPTEDRLIYASQREADRRWRLYTSRGDGSDEVDLRREGHGPTFAPDGRRFAFIGCDLTGNNCGLWQTDVDRANLPSGAALILVNEKAASPDWSPTGEQIAYMANINGNWDLYLVNSDGRNARRLTTDRAIDGLPAWSPDGGWLAFLSNRGNNWGIWLLHLDSGETGQIFAFDGGIFTPPHREPYGERNWEDEQLSWSQ